MASMLQAERNSNLEEAARLKGTVAALESQVQVSFFGFNAMSAWVAQVFRVTGYMLSKPGVCP